MRKSKQTIPNIEKLKDIKLNPVFATDKNYRDNNQFERNRFKPNRFQTNRFRTNRFQNNRVKNNRFQSNRGAGNQNFRRNVNRNCSDRIRIVTT